jgi:hypothetical protein
MDFLFDFFIFFFGDGMFDGWEVYFGLNPLNRSNVFLDIDVDGWDVN